MISVSGTKNAVIFFGFEIWSLLFFWIDGKYPEMSIPVQIYAECPPPRDFEIKTYISSTGPNKYYDKILSKSQVNLHHMT